MHPHLPELKPQCARLVTETNSVGSGFLVGPRLAMTCFHVVKDVREGEKVRCEFDGPVVQERSATIAFVDKLGDIAILELDQPIENVPPIQIRDEQMPGDWLSFSFPALATGAGIPLEGQIQDWQARDPTGKVAVSLRSGMFGEARVGGISGSPVVMQRVVVGMFYAVLGDDGQRKVPQLGHCYAVAAAPLLAALAKLSGNAPPPQKPVPAHLPSHEASEGRAARIFAISQTSSPTKVMAELESADSGERGEVVLVAAERLIALNRARDAVGLLRDEPRSLRRDQLLALALSVCGEHTEAQKLLRGLAPSAETSGVEGGVLKRLWLETKNDAYLEMAYNAYSIAFEREPSAYPAINLAATALYRGDRVTSKTMAEEAVRCVLAIAEVERKYWDWASLAEGHLLLDDLVKARAHYGDAVRTSRGAPRAVATMRRQARLDLQRMGKPSNALDSVLRVGAVAVIAPANVGDTMTEQRIAAALERLDVRQAVVCPCSRTERAFARAASAGATRTPAIEVHVVLPSSVAETRRYLEDGERTELDALLAGVDKRQITEVYGHLDGADWSSALDRARLDVAKLAADLARTIDESPVLLTTDAQGTADPAALFGRIELIEL